MWLNKIVKLLKALQSPKVAFAHVARRYLDNYNGFSYDFFQNGEEDLIKKMRIFEPKVVFDVGANVGDWTQIALDNFPSAKIHCFELSKSTYSNLYRNIQCSQAILNNFGLSDNGGSCAYKDFGENSRVNTILLSSTFHDAHRAPDLRQAQLRTGDSYCLEEGIEFIDFLKIDVEGAEHHVLAGFESMIRQRGIRLIQFEYGYTNGDSKFLMRDFYEYFEERGYVIGRVRKAIVTFEGWSYSLNDFNSGPNFIAIRETDDELMRALSQPRF